MVSKGFVVLLGGMLITGTLGSIHAFSVFVTPVETSLALSRSSVSSIYSLALVCLTLSVLFGHRIYARFSVPALAIGAGGLAALGLLIASHSTSIWGLYLGYSVLFGGANGLGYGFVLQLVGQALPTRTGMAMGSVTAVYAVGAMAFAKVFASIIESANYADAFAVMAAVLAVAGILAASVFWRTNVRYSAPSVERTRSTGPSGLLRTFWLGYGFATLAGLMAMAHAAGLVASRGGSGSQLVAGAILIGFGNALGGVTAGWLADRWAARHLLIALPLISALVLIGLALSSTVNLMIAGLVVLGFAYGALIAVYPVATAHYFTASAWAYGRIFTAWGLAGLGGPWIAGFLFDRTGDYALALWLAATAAILSAVCVLALPANGKEPRSKVS